METVVGFEFTELPRGDYHWGTGWIVTNGWNSRCTPYVRIAVARQAPFEPMWFDGFLSDWTYEAEWNIGQFYDKKKWGRDYRPLFHNSVVKFVCKPKKKRLADN